MMFVVAAGAGQAPHRPIPAALSSITASELKGDLSFLSSDALQGRYTPSPGLEIAAEFIASRFREAGLKPGGDDGYFQTAHMIERNMPKSASGRVIDASGQGFTIPPDSLSVLSIGAAAHVNHAPVLFVSMMDPTLLKGLAVSGKAIVVPQPDFRNMSREQFIAAYSKSQVFQDLVQHSKAALEVLITKSSNTPSPQLIPATGGRPDFVPRIGVTGPIGEQLRSPNGAVSKAISIDIPAPRDRQVIVKNVIAILPGSDVTLKESCVLVTAHYDHIGTRDTGARLANPASTPNPNDHIYNGANDDGSGTVSVIAIARALAKVNPRPKRSIVFVTFFGEERGERGSAYYVQHPVFAIQKSIADVNLEQVGRTDELEDGKIVPQINTLSVTGFDYSDVSSYLIRAGQQLGVKLYKDAQASDPYFTQSDNAAFAEQGIPAHSVSVAFDYPDYHGVGDEWQKIDYENMARVDRVIGLAVLHIANALNQPRWAAQDPKTARFREAQSRRSSRQ
jgi:Zn-dependent M28 family amino/carboxypeptidase